MNNKMVGYQVSQSRANRLHNLGYDIYLSYESGYYIDVTNIDTNTVAYKIYKTGDNLVDIPQDVYKVR